MKIFQYVVILTLIVGSSGMYGFPRIKKVSSGSLKVTRQLLQKMKKDQITNQLLTKLTKDNAFLAKSIQEMNKKLDDIDQKSLLGCAFIGFTWLLVLFK